MEKHLVTMQLQNADLLIWLVTFSNAQTFEIEAVDSDRAAKLACTEHVKARGYLTANDQYLNLWGQEIVKYRPMVCNQC